MWQDNQLQWEEKFKSLKDEQNNSEEFRQIETSNKSNQNLNKDSGEWTSYFQEFRVNSSSSSWRSHLILLMHAVVYIEAVIISAIHAQEIRFKPGLR